jgi:hypothetical protein
MPMVSAGRIPCVLSIAGSDSGGGAGIQADLKAFAACGVHGMTAITAITAQNTVGVTAVETISPQMIRAQVRAVAQDIGVDAVKIGMLGTSATIEAVARALDELPEATPIVLDPVMVSESGSELLEPDARGALVELLLPRVLVVTPNVPEARVLAGVRSDAAGTAAAPAATDAGPAPTSSRGATARWPPTCSSMSNTSWRSTGSGTRARPPTALAAPTHRSSRHGWRGVTARCRRRARPSAGRRRRSRAGSTG